MTQDKTPESSLPEGWVNTAAGWVLFAGILALGFSILSGKYFHADNPERPETLGYIIDGVEVADEGADAGPTFVDFLATATPQAGEVVFARCASCHTIAPGGANGTGPNLHGIMGQPKAAIAGFGYSGALSDMGGEWTWENMDAWLANPRGYVNGTSMSFAGLSDPEDRANLMVFMESLGGAPARPEPAAEEATAEEGGEEVEGEDGAVAAAEAEQDAAAEIEEGGA